LSEKLDFLKTCKNSYTIPLSIIDPEYGGHNQEIWNFGQFLPQASDFQKNRRLTAMDFEHKFDFFENL
jgi:hypothetical protein